MTEKKCFMCVRIVEPKKLFHIQESKMETEKKEVVENAGTIFYLNLFLVKIFLCTLKARFFEFLGLEGPRVIAELQLVRVIDKENERMEKRGEKLVIEKVFDPWYRENQLRVDALKAKYYQIYGPWE